MSTEEFSEWKMLKQTYAISVFFLTYKNKEQWIRSNKKKAKIKRFSVNDRKKGAKEKCERI